MTANNDDLNSGLGLGDGSGMSEEALGRVAESNPFDAPSPRSASVAPNVAPAPVSRPTPERREEIVSEAADRLTRTTEGSRNLQFYEEARTLHEESQQAFREAQAKGDSEGMERSLRHIGVASQRMADEDFRVESERLGFKRSMTDDQARRIDAAIAEQKKTVDYLDDLVTKGTEDPSFIPQGQSLEDWKRNLQAERKALNQLTVGREAGRQRAPVEDPSFLGETARSFTTGMIGTVAETYGGALKQIGATSGVPGISDVGEGVRAFGKDVRQDTASQSSPEVLKLGEKGAFFTELKNYVGAKLGEGIGTSVPIIAAAIAAGPVAGVSAGMAMGIGQMRNSLEEAFAEEGVTFPEDKAAFYVYTYGTAIGALESAMEVMGVSRMTGALKQRAIKSLAQTIAKGAAIGAVTEGVTETMQEMLEIAGVSQATGKPIDWSEAGRRLVEAGAAGAVPGTAFGTVSSTVERQGAIDKALKKADALGFRNGTDGRSEKGKNFRPVSDQGQASETVRDVSPSLDQNVSPGAGPSVRQPMADADPEIERARAIIDGVTQPEAMRDAEVEKTVSDQRDGSASVTRDAPVRDAPPVVPTFAQVLEALPKDEAGDPDVGALMSQVTEFGAKAWGGLNDEQKAAVYQRFAPVVERAAPVIERVAEAVQSGEAAQIVKQVAEAVAPAATASVEEANAAFAARRARLDAKPKASAEATLEALNQPRPAPARTEAQIKAAFDATLASKTKRSDWASAVGVDQAQLDGLINEALKDGRLKKTKAGGIVRTAKAKATGQLTGQDSAPGPATTAAMTGQTTGQEATRTIDRPTEVRANASKNDVARRYGIELAEAPNTESVGEIIDRLKGDRKGTHATLSEIVKIITGTSSKAKSKAAVYAQIETAVGNRLAKPSPAITTEASGQTSLVPEVTDKDRLQVAAGKPLTGGNAPADFGLFGSSSQQLDLVEMSQATAVPAAREAVKREPRPVSLIAFLRARGGINDDGGDLRAMEAHKRPGLVNYRNGLTLDHAREIAVEAGYLKDTGEGLAQTSTADLLDAIREELAGRPTYSTADDARVADMRDELAAEIADAQRSNYVEQLQDWHTENGLSFRMSEREIDRAAVLMIEGQDIESAVEAAFIEAVEDEIGTGTAPAVGRSAEEESLSSTFDDGSISLGSDGRQGGGVRRLAEKQAQKPKE